MSPTDMVFSGICVWIPCIKETMIMMIIIIINKLFTLEEQMLTLSAVTNLIHHCDCWQSRNK